MNTQNDIIKFYGNPIFHKKKKLIADDYMVAYQEGKTAATQNHAISENPYDKEDDAIWGKADCWIEGYKSVKGDY